jgi:hypothetical protein
MWRIEISLGAPSTERAVFSNNSAARNSDSIPLHSFLSIFESVQSHSESVAHPSLQVSTEQRGLDICMNT